ncbi:MAG: hypothetical protein JWM87_3180 [Candidatus Eremiobacteraeota bacterium]|nr:hypothetical protein [Candidatus Eremiobacteraeota bacterium]
MANDDYAIVIGINDYPGMIDAPDHAGNLQGPVNDATAIHAWLTDPAKGGVDPQKATLIVSPRPLPQNFALGNAQPVVQTIENAFSGLTSLADTKPPPVGRRLYVYMSGHGFAPERAKGAVFVADATKVSTRHVFATAWLDWFYNAAYFDELVLWLDCCMKFHFTVVPQAPSLARIQGNSSGARVFSAYSAKFKQESVEDEMPDGLFHGVFTYTLLQGLESAVDASGNITTASLKQYLINRMKFNMPAKFKQIGTVSQEPDFGFDDSMVFVTGAPIPAKDVLLNGIPDGTKVDILGGNPSDIVASAVVQNGKVSLSLRPGVYAAQADGDSTLHGFQV